MTQSRSRTIVVLAALLGVALTGGGTLKLIGQATQVAQFVNWGLPMWFLTLVGTFEVLGGVLLIVPATTPAGSLILSTIMVGALWGHVVHSDWPHAIPVVVLLTLFLTIFRRTRAQAVHLLYYFDEARSTNQSTHSLAHARS
jgi:uncharacterized membrane protein YphA (DoxX/SURF4 family)